MSTSCNTPAVLDKYLGVLCPVCHNIYATDANDPLAPCQDFECGHAVCVNCYDELRVTRSSRSNDYIKECPTCKVESAPKDKRLISYALMGLVAELKKEQECEQLFYMACHICKDKMHIDRAWVCSTCANADLDKNPDKVCSFCCMEKHRGHELKRYLPYKNKTAAKDAEAEFHEVVHNFHTLILSNNEENENGFVLAEKAIRLTCERAREAPSITVSTAFIQNARENVKEFEVATDAFVPALRVYSLKIKEFIDKMNKVGITPEKSIECD